jgi:hypothetical protein
LLHFVKSTPAKLIVDSDIMTVRAVSNSSGFLDSFGKICFNLATVFSVAGKVVMYL